MQTHVLQRFSSAVPGMTMKPDVILIRGAPGSGKSLTAKCLAKRFPKGTRVEVDTLRCMVISPDWTSQPEHLALLDVSMKVVLDFLNLGFRPVIVVDTFSGGKITKYIDDLYRFTPDSSLCIVGLYASERALKKRIGARKKGEFRDYDICRQLNSEVREQRCDGELQIDTTGLTPVKTARKILNHVGDISWLFRRRNPE